MTRIRFRLLSLLFVVAILSNEALPQSSARSISLRKIGKYGVQYTDKTLRISNVILEEVRSFENDWPHLFQLYDPRKKFRRGAMSKYDNPCCIQEFSIFSDEDIGEILLKRKEDWFGKRVNVYVIITDRGLTPLVYIGYVTKVERLNQKGEVELTIP